MLSSKSIGSGGGAASYYENLASEDYYTKGGEPPGKWVGEYARDIGLTGEVKKGELAAGFAGFHPRTGEQIANNAGADHKAGYDLTFSAPKSVSTTWATGDRETQQAISAAQQRAVEKALDYASKHAFHQREGHAGSVKVEHTSGIAAATFEHGTSREGDPQLHTHALVMNMAENGKRIDFDTRWKHAAGAAYRVELANEMQALGYKVERDGSSFKIDGVPDSLEREFSTRRQQIEAAMREHGTSGGKAAQAAALATRETKGEVNRAELFERAREVAKEHGFNPESIRAHEFISGERRVVERDKFDSVAFIDAACAQASTLTRPQLEKELFQAAQGSMTIEQAQAKLEHLKARGELVELRDNEGGPNRWTTREMLAIEQRIANTAERMKGEKTHHVSQSSLDTAIARKTLSDDQKQALAHITGPERVAVVQGVAGAGKSYMLDAARDAWERDGYTVRGAALAGKAAEGLEESSGIASSTIHSLVGQLDRDQIKLDSKTIVVLDEAGMIGSRLFDCLQQHVDAAGAKLVLVGDTQQLQPIDAGGAMRAIQDRVGAVIMDDIRRQKDPEQRQIVRDFKDGKADAAIDRLEKLGAVKTYENAAAVRSGTANAVIRDMQDGKTSIGLAGTRAEVHQVNQLAKAEAQQAGLVSDKNHEFKTERGARQFSDGDRVIFLENNRLDAPRGGVGSVEVKNGTTGTVEKAGDGVLRVNLDNGKTVMVREDKYRHIDHGYAMTVHKSQGVTVDRAHLMPGRMTDQHSAYVGASRHRETVQIHGTAEQVKEMRQTASRDHTKDTSADQRYTPIERQGASWKTQHDSHQSTSIERAASKLEEMKQAFSERVAELRERFGPEQAKEVQAEQAQVRPDPEAQQAREGDQPAKDTAQAEQQTEVQAKDATQVEQQADQPAKDTDAAQARASEQPQQAREGEQPKARDTEPAKDSGQPGKTQDPQRQQAKGAAAKQPEPPKARDQVKPEPKAEQLAKPDQVKQQEPARMTPKQAEQRRQVKAETERHRQRKPEHQAQQQRQLKAEAERHRQRQPERQTERERTPSKPSNDRGR